MNLVKCIDIKWASVRENLSSGFATKLNVSNKSAELHIEISHEGSLDNKLSIKSITYKGTDQSCWHVTKSGFLTSRPFIRTIGTIRPFHFIFLKFSTPLTPGILMNSSIWFNTMSMGWFIVHNKGHKFDFPNNNIIHFKIILSLQTVKTLMHFFWVFTVSNNRLRGFQNTKG